MPRSFSMSAPDPLSACIRKRSDIGPIHPSVVPDMIAAVGRTSVGDHRSQNEGDLFHIVIGCLDRVAEPFEPSLVFTRFHMGSFHFERWASSPDQCAWSRLKGRVARNQVFLRTARGSLSSLIGKDVSKGLWVTCLNRTGP